MCEERELTLWKRLNKVLDVVATVVCFLVSERKRTRVRALCMRMRAHTRTHAASSSTMELETFAACRSPVVRVGHPSRSGSSVV